MGSVITNLETEGFSSIGCEDSTTSPLDARCKVHQRVVNRGGWSIEAVGWIAKAHG
jgi:hypothetical protein